MKGGVWKSLTTFPPRRGRWGRRGGGLVEAMPTVVVAKVTGFHLVGVVALAGRRVAIGRVSGSVGVVTMPRGTLGRRCGRCGAALWLLSGCCRGRTVVVSCCSTSSCVAFFLRSKHLEMSHQSDSSLLWDLQALDCQVPAEENILVKKSVVIF